MTQRNTDDILKLIGMVSNWARLDRKWYENGYLKEENYYEDDAKVVLRRTWHKNGQLENEENYKDGKREGLRRTWYENGQLEKEVKD